MRGLFYWEIIAPGREAHNELFAYEELSLRLDLRAAGRPIAVERLHLTPATKPLQSLARLGPYRYFATFYLCRVGLPSTTWLMLEKALQEIAHTLTDPQTTDPPTTVWGVSTLPAHGLSVRALSMNSRALLAGLPHFWQAAKWALYGQNAVMPRKVY